MSGAVGLIAANSPLYATSTTLQMHQYQINIIPKWSIIGYGLYFIDSTNKVRNIQTGKVLQMQLKGYTKGYYLNGRFMSLKQIRPLLQKYKDEKLPFLVT